MLRLFASFLVVWDLVFDADLPQYQKVTDVGLLCKQAVFERLQGRWCGAPQRDERVFCVQVTITTGT